MYVVQEESGVTMKTLDERISDLEREVQSLRHIVEKGLSVIDIRHPAKDTDNTKEGES